MCRAGLTDNSHTATSDDGGRWGRCFRSKYDDLLSAGLQWLMLLCVQNRNMDENQITHSVQVHGRARWWMMGRVVGSLRCSDGLLCVIYGDKTDFQLRLMNRNYASSCRGDAQKRALQHPTVRNETARSVCVNTLLFTIWTTPLTGAYTGQQAVKRLS